MQLKIPWFPKKKKEDNKVATLEEVRKAYEDLSDDDKKSFHQSIFDRVHESIGEQEHDDGDKDSQSAADREHEALGAEHADGEGEVKELHETDPEDGKKDKPEKSDDDDRYKALLDRLNALEASIKSGSNDTDAEAARKAEQVYGLGNDVFEAARSDDGKISAKEASAIVRGLKV